MLFSIGLLDFGLFFYVFCLGHFAYLLHFSTRLAVSMLAMVFAADLLYGIYRGWMRALRFGLMPIACGLIATGLATWADLPIKHGVVLALLVPLAVSIGHFTLGRMEQDMGIRTARLQPGRGRLICSLSSYLFLAPLVFHYFRWFLRWGDL